MMRKHEKGKEPEGLVPAQGCQTVWGVHAAGKGGEAPFFSLWPGRRRLAKAHSPVGKTRQGWGRADLPGAQDGKNVPYPQVPRSLSVLGRPMAKRRQARRNTKETPEQHGSGMVRYIVTHSRTTQ